MEDLQPKNLNSLDAQDQIDNTLGSVIVPYSDSDKSDHTIKILLVGGGSGGHLTPLVAVATALKIIKPNVIIRTIGQKGEHLLEAGTSSSIDSYGYIYAGKFRRYHGSSFMEHLRDYRTIMLNIKDFFKFCLGFLQSLYELTSNRPDAILLKGGFVSVPIGFAAKILRIPYVTHDSDVVPGLANRLTAKSAKFNLTAMPKSLYPYQADKTIQVGIPLRETFIFVSKAVMSLAKESLERKITDEIVLVSGGGLGARRVNQAVVEASSKILADHPNRYIYHLAGKKLYEETLAEYEAKLSEQDRLRVNVVDFTTEPEVYGAAADLIITRAGATTLAEYSVQAKTCIVIPNPHLTGGQQLHNAKVLEDAGAAVILKEEQLDQLPEIVNEFFRFPEKRELLARHLNALAVPDSAAMISKILLKIAKTK